MEVLRFRGYGVCIMYQLDGCALAKSSVEKSCTAEALFWKDPCPTHGQCPVHAQCMMLGLSLSSGSGDCKGLQMCKDLSASASAPGAAA